VRRPAVSVLLPVRDASATLEACLASLAGQTLGDHEVVAVDDGSTDGSRELLARAASGDRRLRVLSRPAEGLVSALNAGLAAARAPFLARMDADDVAHPERLHLQVAYLRAEPTVHVLGSRVEILGGRDNRGMQAYVEWSNRLLDHAAIERDMFVESPLVHPSITLRTSALRALGGYRAFFGPEDYDLWLRARAAGLRFSKLAEPLLSWRDSPTRLTRRDPRYAAARFQDLKIERLADGPLWPGRRVVIWGAGPVGKSWARALLPRGHAVQAFVEVDPRKIGQRIHGAPVVSVTHVVAPDGALHLAAVADAGARRRIRAEATRLGRHEGPDLVAVA
jgi:cellulose synthase/poly-beta-1,6-N-acetylglucosamine synthase-like glycosyltransferase